MKISKIKKATAKAIAADEEMQQYLLDKTAFLPESATWARRKWHVVNEVDNAPTCSKCQSAEAKWTGRGYDDECQLAECEAVEPTELTLESLLEFDVKVPPRKSKIASKKPLEKKIRRVEIIAPEDTTLARIAGFIKRLTNEEPKVTKRYVEYKSKKISDLPMKGALLITEAEWKANESLARDLIQRHIGAMPTPPIDLFTTGSLQPSAQRNFFNSATFVPHTCRVAIGAFSNAVVVSGIGLNLIEDNHWEIIQSANRVGKLTPGAFARCFGYFVSTFRPEQVSMRLDEHKNDPTIWTDIGFVKQDSIYVWKK